MPDCASLPERQRAICEGRVALPLHKTNAYRRMWGLEPLAAGSTPAPRSPSVVAPSSAVATLSRGCCGGQSRRQTNGVGPGSKLLERWSDFPHCDACLELAAQMDNWGPAGCRARLNYIVDDILPRARVWVQDNHPILSRLGSLVGAADFVLRKFIEHEVQAAIAAADKAMRRARSTTAPDLAAELAELAAGRAISADAREERAGLCAACPLSGRCEDERRIDDPTATCRLGRWFPAVLPERRFDSDVRRNLMFHLLPVRRNGLWRRHVEWQRKYWSVFTGRKIIAIVHENRPPRRGKRDVRTVDADEVLRQYERLGMAWDDVIVKTNSTDLWEVASFVTMLPRVESTDPNEITFYCHGKATTHDEQSICVHWAEVMYETCLRDMAAVERALRSHVFAGSFRRFGEFRTPGNNRWHYSGTFYWFRNSEVFTRDWKRIDRKFFGTESWPGLMARVSESVCLFGDNAGTLYEVSQWSNILDPLLEQWRMIRGDSAD